MNRLKQFLKTSGVFFIGNTLTKIISFLLLPLYTSKLAPEAFGYYDLTISVLSLIVPIVFFQIWDGVFRFTFDYKDNIDKYKVISNGFIIQASGIICYIAVFCIFNYLYEVRCRELIFIYGVLVAFQYFYNCVARSFSKNSALVMTGLLNSIINLTLNFILISYYDFGIEALYLSYIIGTAVQVVFLEVKLKILKNLSLNTISLNLVIKMVKFSLPLCILTASYWLLSGFTRFMISNELGMFENGLFAVANRFTAFLMFIVNVFQFAWYEMSYSLVGDKNKEKYFSMSINFIMRLVLFLGAPLLILIKLIFPYFISDSYKEALIILPILFTGVLLNSFTSFASTLFLAEKDSKKLLIPTLFAAFVNILGLTFLTKPFGLIGATLALALSYFTNAVLIIIKLNSAYNIRLNNKVAITGILIYGVSILIFYYNYQAVYLMIAFLALLIISIYMFKDIIGMGIKILKKYKKL